MSIIIRHGANGSYKSAVIVFNHIIEGLKQGRLVVTNMEGMYPLDYLERVLNLKFPDGAALVRIGSTTDVQLNLWRNWFSWMPIGALIVIDEVQSVYDAAATKKPILLQPHTDFASDLPENIIKHFDDMRNSIKSTDFDEGDTDDTGILRFNPDGSIIYPKDLKDAFSRHRKFNWDIVFGTPDITEVPKTVRSCAEKAFAQRARDEFFMTKRKPRIYEHPPLENGLSPKKEFTTSLKVPLWAFLCYKSTQTNKNTKSGQGNNPLKSPKLIMIMVLICVSLSYFVYSVYAIFTRSEKSNYESFVENSSVEKGHPVNNLVSEKNVLTTQNDTKTASSSFTYNDLLSFASSGNSNPRLKLPYSAHSAYLTGYFGDKYLFTFTRIDGTELLITSLDLQRLKYVVIDLGDGVVKVKNALSLHEFICILKPVSIDSIDVNKMAVVSAPVTNNKNVIANSSPVFKTLN